MSDMEVANQLADTLFISYLSAKNAEQIKTMLKVKNVSVIVSGANMGWKTTIENLSDYVISGSDYKVTCTFIRWNKTFPGQDIQPGETRSFTMMVDPNEGVASSVVKFKLSDAELLAKYFKPTGDEYPSYLRSPLRGSR